MLQTRMHIVHLLDNICYKLGLFIRLSFNIHIYIVDNVSIFNDPSQDAMQLKGFALLGSAESF